MDKKAKNFERINECQNAKQSCRRFYFVRTVEEKQAKEAFAYNEEEKK